MALVKCPECKKKISTKANTCPNCGAPVESPPKKKHSGCGCLLAILMIGGGIALGIAIKNTPSPSPSSAPAKPTPLIPYTVINRQEFQHYKVSIDVRLDLVEGRLPTEQELGAISRRLHSEEKKHDKTFVLFYLPGMKVDAGAFASAHHEPNMQVKILEHNLPDKYRKLTKE
jgi:hypothetical protein